MPQWRGSWSRFAATSGFPVRASRQLRYVTLVPLLAWCLAVVAAPVAVVVASVLVLPAYAARGRFPWLPRRLVADRILLDTRNGLVRLQQPGGQTGCWRLRSWLRHPWLIILYLERAGDHGCVVLPADATDRRARRRLHYLLGVSTVARGSEASPG